VSLHGWRAPWRVWLLLAVPLLLPFGRLGELPLLIGAGVGLVALLRAPRAMWSAEAKLATLLFAAYWLPELASAFDSVAARKSWLEVASDLRYLPFLWFACGVCRAPGDPARLVSGFAAILALWCADALMQALTGWSLGGPGTVDRLSGIFGDDNLKLGGAVAALSTFGLWFGWTRWRMRGLVVALVPLLVVVLLAGARAAWLVLAIGFALVCWRALGARRGVVAAGAALLLAAAAGVASYAASPRFAARVDRTAAALSGDTAAIDHALSGRLPIWRTALAMGAAHPINGVGVRAFRYAYPDYSAADDPWVQPATGQGAMHAHQLLLELVSETGAIGLLAWWLGALVAWRRWRAASDKARARAAPAAYALCAMLFPINTHYAVYSSFWGLLLMAMLAVWLALLAANDDAEFAA
jgi:O-antigen ligase